VMGLELHIEGTVSSAGFRVYVGGGGGEQRIGDECCNNVRRRHLKI
jgi:hypothetical protein